MSTVRAARHLIDTGWQSLGIDRRTAALLAIACVLVFACVFAIARWVSPDSAPAEAGASGLPSTPLSSAVPVALTTAAPIAAGAAVAPPPPPPVHHARRGGGGATVAPPPVTQAPVTQTPVTQTPVTQAPVRQPAPPPSKPKAAPTGGGEGTFDSSG
jgi:hypothetical protein